MGKRAEKDYSGGTSNIFTWYVRDASGNVMATYGSTTNNSSNPGNLSVKERHIYGSSRLGILTQKSQFILKELKLKGLSL